MTHPIADHRAKERLTLEAFASKIGATKGMVSKWESGKALPRAQYMARIVVVTNGDVSADSLLRAFVEAQSDVVPEAAE